MREAWLVKSKAEISIAWLVAAISARSKSMIGH
jgi:hypothetical protein